jgi:hypothetical protein
MKKVRLTLEVDDQFIRLLNANVNLSGAMMSTLKGDPTRQLSPKEVLAIMVLGEARGATEEQLHAALPLEWRSNLELIHSERQVYQDGKLISAPAGTRKFIQDFLEWANHTVVRGPRITELKAQAEKLIHT